jgi:phosphoribosylaminoimidazolecarboxamide formyltransferase/IMP cyclohydrolase
MSDASVNVKRALISVSDKTGLISFARALAAMGVELLSTGGTARSLSESGLQVTEVAAETGFPEIMDGRVKTLHPKIHGGLLARRDNADHMAAMAANEIRPIDLLVVNLYPFEATLAAGADYETCVENIDIGGPAMIRAAAKNHDHVAVIVEPADYDTVVEELTASGGITVATRRQLARTAYARTAAYDAAIANWLAEEQNVSFPDRLVIAGAQPEIMRYGENPHQAAAFYRTGDNRPGVASAVQVQGKALSFNNLNDTDAAYELVAEFDRPAIAIIKHANPCGVAVADTLKDAYLRALACDPVSAFGGIIAANRRLDADTAAEIVKILSEVVIAPEADAAAGKILAEKKNLRLLVAGGLPDPAAGGINLRSLAGGLLVQDRDAGRINENQLNVVTKRAPSDQEMADLILAFRICKHVKSNAIIYVKDGATVGIGAGQMSRVDSARIAARKAEDAAEAAGAKTVGTIGSVVASDAFFPFADGLLAAAAAGATAVIQPGGSIRDAEIIAAADDAGLAMVLTVMRHFRH